ncbi:hypothetical protein BDR07DRAFT_1490132 [Suillus spraguei]|nr:hypothetical protein BDR07DRAFT_1490132 [Suillus spraguei]
MQDDDSGLQPSSKEKGGIHAIIAEKIFARDVHYGKYYQAYPQKFTVAVGNRLTLFNQTGSGVDPRDPSAVANLHEDVLRQLPTYNELNELWCSIPSYAPKAFSSDHKADHSGHLLSIMHTKGAPTSTAAASSCPALDDDNKFYDENADIELDGSDPSHDPKSLSLVGDNDNDLNYNMLGDGEMDNDVEAGDGEMNADANEDYDMAAYETATSGKNRVDKRPCPFSPSPPPEIVISPTMAPHTPVSDSQASFANYTSHAISCTSLSKPCRPPSSVASSILSSSA